MLINPPPESGKCYQCDKVRPLRKTFRAILRGTDNEQVGASWECEDCIGLEIEE